MMITNKEMQEAVSTATSLVEEINTVLNKAIADDYQMDDTERNVLRQVRDENIQTFLKIQDLRLRGLL